MTFLSYFESDIYVLFCLLFTNIPPNHFPTTLPHTMQFLLSTGHTENAWFLFETNFNFGLTDPKNDAEADNRQLEFCIKS